jgi:hypothetical protein
VKVAQKRIRNDFGIRLGLITKATEGDPYSAMGVARATGSERHVPKAQPTELLSRRPHVTPAFDSVAIKPIIVGRNWYT